MKLATFERSLALVGTVALLFQYPAGFALADSINDVCSDSNGPDISQQKQQYCNAAKAADKAASADNMVWKAYAAVTGVCTTECISSMFMGAGEIMGWVCTGTAASAGVFDAIETRNYMSAVQSIAGAGMGILLNHMMASGAQDGSKTSQANYGACLEAANAAMQTIMTKSSADNQMKTRDQNLAIARKLRSVNRSLILTDLQGGSNINSGGLANALGSAGTTNPTDRSRAPASAPAAPGCGAAVQSGSPGAAIQCAAAADPNLKSVLGNSNFADEFKKTSGTDLAKFLQTPLSSPAQAITRAMGGAVKGEALEKLAGAVNQMQQRYMPETGGEATVYAGGGGGGGSHGDGDDLAIGFANFMNQLMPKKNGEGGPSTGVNLNAFGKVAQRNLASASPEDRSVSIFDRVASRYASLTPRLLMADPKSETLNSWTDSH